MNLTKLFNLNYLVQNIKKSRVVLAIFIGLIPILNTIILIMTITSNYNHILNFAEISIINLIGIYILPIIISICLFNYIYKKKSVDFINSMPISRKSIYTTNTILGIIIFTIMLLINTILIWSTCKIFGSPIPFMMLFDYFWFFLLVYIFVFSATNLAMTISGNAITQIIVSLLLLFLVPYTTAYLSQNYNSNTNYNTMLECTTENCKPEKYYCYNDKECELNKQINQYRTGLYPVNKPNNFTTPFNLLSGTLLNEGTLINLTSTIKMLILTITYIILGYFTFLKRKMEISETTFKSPHIHNIVKSLTLVPMVSIACLILNYDEPIFIIFVIVILLIYYFVYDLITKKSIQNIKLSCIYFTVTIIVLSLLFGINPLKEKTDIIKYNNLKEISIDLNTYSDRSDTKKIYIDNKEIISLMTKAMLNEETNNNEYLSTYFKTTDKKEYEVTIGLTEEKYQQLLSLLEKEKEYVDYYKNINIDEVYALQVGNKTYKKEEAKPYLDLINNSLNKITLKEFLELQRKYYYVENYYYLKLYTYNNHDSQVNAINGYINYDLLNTIVNSNNSLLKDKITPVIPWNYQLYYENAYLKDTFDIDFYIIRSAKNELYEFILKNKDEEVDMRKEHFAFGVVLNSVTFHFTTNKVEEVKEILTNKYEEFKNTEDYKNYYGDIEKEETEYYD